MDRRLRLNRAHALSGMGRRSSAPHRRRSVCGTTGPDRRAARSGLFRGRLRVGSSSSCSSVATRSRSSCSASSFPATSLRPFAVTSAIVLSIACRISSEPRSLRCFPVATAAHIPPPATAKHFRTKAPSRYDGRARGSRCSTYSAGLAGLSHHPVPVSLKEELLDFRGEVVGQHDELLGVLSNRLVLLDAQDEPECAVLVRALTEVLVAAFFVAELDSDFLNALVDLSEKSLILGHPSLTLIHGISLNIANRIRPPFPGGSSSSAGIRPGEHGMIARCSLRIVRPETRRSSAG